MTMNIPQTAPDILSLVQACTEHVSNAKADELVRAFAPPDRTSNASAPSADQLEAVYGVACRLCDEENFQFASALALHLATYRPREPRFTFLAGTCMQRLNAPASAARFFCFALIHGGDHPAALYRLGECLLAIGDTVNADRAFDAALDVARDVKGAEDLQSASQRMMDLIKTGAAPSPQLSSTETQS